MSQRILTEVKIYIDAGLKREHLASGLGLIKDEDLCTTGALILAQKA